MILQHDENTPDPTPGRARAWRIAYREIGGTVVVRHAVTDLQPDEHLDDYPPTHELTWAEWQRHCHVYGLAEDGTGPGDGAGPEVT